MRAWRSAECCGASGSATASHFIGPISILMDRVAWSELTDAEIVARRAGGRRRYNTVRQFRRDLRWRALLERCPSLLALVSHTGMQQRLAAELGVHPSTMAREVKASLLSYRPCPLCGHWVPRESFRAS